MDTEAMVVRWGLCTGEKGIGEDLVNHRHLGCSVWFAGSVCLELESIQGGRVAGDVITDVVLDDQIYSPRIMGKKYKSSKRKSREIEVATDGLGGKDGNVIDDLSEPTMGEKLASLKLEEYDKPLNHDNADFSLSARPPNADSISYLSKHFEPMVQHFL
ncbi:hypothetical protein OROGR_009584 [Orobanche gracilis]